MLRPAPRNPMLSGQTPATLERLEMRPEADRARLVRPSRGGKDAASERRVSCGQRPLSKARTGRSPVDWRAPDNPHIDDAYFDPLARLERFRVG